MDLSINPVKVSNFKMDDSARDFEEDHENCEDRVFNSFMDEVLLIKQNLNQIIQEIEIVKTKQEIKEVKLERIGMIAKVHEVKIIKVEEKVWENDEKINGIDRKLENIEKVFEGVRDYREKNSILAYKQVRIENAVKLLRKHSQIN